MIALSRRADAWMTARYITWLPRFKEELHESRYALFALVIVLSVLDLTLTQSILTMVEGLSGVQPGEANALMAPIVMTWWAWPIRVGVPAIIAFRDLRKKQYNLMFTGCLLYGAVVIWNAYMYLLVRGSI